MNGSDFVNAIRISVVDNSIKSVLTNLASPPGRTSAKQLVDLSQWYNSLNESDRGIILKLVEASVETAVFGFLAVLDGVRVIETGENKGELQLYY